MSKARPGWTPQDGEEIYGIRRWGSGYFSADQQGRLVVSPRKDAISIPILDIIEEAAKQGFALPLHVRFQNILHDRVRELNEAFASAIAEQHYKGRYQGVYPVKVNQLREVVETIVDAGSPWNLGLEAGSKAELVLALSLHHNYESLLICNGYKDEEFIRHALNAVKLGKKVVIVAEKLDEVKALVSSAKQLGVRPILGIRARLATRSQGKWATSSGDNAKFGLSTLELLDAISYLEAEGMKDCFQLLHFHLGSQIPDIRVLSRGVREAARFYAKLRRMGCPISWIDCGGGLGVDYDGSQSSGVSSVNYSLAEYAGTLVSGISTVCDQEGVGHPGIITESGRALVAHHSMIVVEAMSAIKKESSYTPPVHKSETHRLVRDLEGIMARLDAGKRIEAFHRLAHVRDEALTLFDLGYLELEDRALVESLSWKIAEQIALSYGSERAPDEIREVIESLKDQYLFNFSVFRALPDFWALGQLFPIVPLHRLGEKPSAQATIVDITCDSDGKIDHFINENVHEAPEANWLPLHTIDDKPYYLGIFLTGAYQDTLGDMHNLFGRMHEVHILIDSDEEAGWYIDETIQGDRIDEILAQNEYSSEELTRSYKAQIDKAIHHDIVKPREGKEILDYYEKGLKSYTYLGKPSDPK